MNKGLFDRLEIQGYRLRTALYDVQHDPSQPNKNMLHFRVRELLDLIIEIKEREGLLQNDRQNPRQLGLQ